MSGFNAGAAEPLKGFNMAIDLDEKLGYHALEKCETCGHVLRSHLWRLWMQPCKVKGCLCDHFVMDQEDDTEGL